MQLISKFNNGNRFLLRVIDIFSTYEWFIPLKDEKSTTITNAFQKILDKSNHKPNKTWVDKGSEFYNRSMKSFLRNNNIDMYSMHNEGKSIVAERFIRTLKYKIYKHMTLILKNVYIDRLDDIVNKYNNTYHGTSKTKPIDIKPSIYILTLIAKIIRKILNLKLVIMLEYHNIKIFLQKVTLQIGLKKFLCLLKLKILCRGHILLVILTEKQLLELFTKKNTKNTNQKEFRVEKVIKRKSNKLYVKLRGYDSSFTSWIDKKRHNINE